MAAIQKRLEIIGHSMNSVELRNAQQTVWRSAARDRLQRLLQFRGRRLPSEAIAISKTDGLGLIAVGLGGDAARQVPRLALNERAVH